jgi:hypothetical protein
MQTCHVHAYEHSSAYITYIHAHSSAYTSYLHAHLKHLSTYSTPIRLQSMHARHQQVCMRRSEAPHDLTHLFAWPNSASHDVLRSVSSDLSSSGSPSPNKCSRTLEAHTWLISLLCQLLPRTAGPTTWAKALPCTLEDHVLSCYLHT